MKIRNVYLFSGDDKEARKEATRARKRAEYRRNRTAILAKRKLNYLKNKDRDLKRIGEWKKKNAERVKEWARQYARAWRALHPGVNAERCRRWRASNDLSQG